MTEGSHVPTFYWATYCFKIVETMFNFFTLNTKVFTFPLVKFGHSQMARSNP